MKVKLKEFDLFEFMFGFIRGGVIGIFICALIELYIIFS